MYTSDQLKTEKHCLNPVFIKKFLETSRRQTDDNIKNTLNQLSCPQIVSKVFKDWAERDDVFAYCRQVFPANSTQITNSSLFNLSESSKNEIKFAETAADPRVDAYTARNENRVEYQANWIDLEVQKEDIIRENTMDCIRMKCLEVPDYLRK